MNWAGKNFCCMVIPVDRSLAGSSEDAARSPYP